MSENSNNLPSSGEPSSKADECYLAGIVNWRLTVRSHAWEPNTDVYDDGEDIVIRVEIAGMHESDFSINLNQKTITIRGIREDKSSKHTFHQMEIPFGEFFIEIEIPTPIQANQIQANYNNGFFWITLPKALPQQISIQKGSLI